MSELRRSHWEKVYATKDPAEVSWFQPVPERSLQLIQATGIAARDAILDAGGGASTLVDNLLSAGYRDISVLDISAQALERSRKRLADRAGDVCWIEADVTEFVPDRRFDLWHDRAVFHFLVEASDRQRYVDVVRASLKPQGYLVLATFGPEGPLRCSGLEIQRYDTEMLQDLLGADFELRHQEIEQHETPSGALQQFLYTWWQARQ